MLFGLAIAIITFVAACLILYFFYNAYYHTEETWIQARKFLEIIKNWLDPEPTSTVASTPKVGFLEVADSKICEIFKWLCTPETYFNISSTIFIIVDRCVGLGLGFANFIAHHPAIFFASTIGIPFARILNIFWFRDATDAIAIVAKSTCKQAAGAITALTNAYVEVGEAVKQFITTGIGGGINMLLIPINITVQLVCILFTGIANLLTFIANILFKLIIF